jgi:hypothetical protein
MALVSQSMPQMFAGGSQQQAAPTSSSTSSTGTPPQATSSTNNSSNAILAPTQPFCGQVSPHEFQPDRPIGYGAFGVVWLVVTLIKHFVFKFQQRTYTFLQYM